MKYNKLKKEELEKSKDYTDKEVYYSVKFYQFIKFFCSDFFIFIFFVITQLPLLFLANFTVSSFITATILHSFAYAYLHKDRNFFGATQVNKDIDDLIKVYQEILLERTKSQTGAKEKNS